MTDETREWLAWVNVGAGCSWCRSTVKDTAILGAIKNLKDWDRLFDVYDVPITVLVCEVTGYGDLIWDYSGVHGVRNGDEEGKYTAVPYTVEREQRQTPPKKRATKRA